ncbi:S-layer homology domain-containing protein [Paenibacillus kobensis]|uniref:S-layer homology domain-containing protein n=1 Tax=Paenibacillus kobensis TaxID=59841 RepID=UPI000FDA34EE|nr:S-layer homology domain-containing protein [Paenibacillus kobensis]
MKKSLSLLVAVCMVFSMFASVAFAADAAQPSTQQKFDALKEQGIFTGYPDGSAGLDKNMTRAQFAVVLKRVNNLENAAAASKYVDVPAKHWAIGEIGAVTKASLMQGVGANKFDPNGNVTIEALATTLVRALDLEPVEGATVAGASAWAAGYVQAALDAKIIPSATNYKAAATRGQLVDATYAFVGGVVSVKSAVAVDAKTVKVTFSDDQVVTKELSEALKAGVATKVTVEYNGKSYTVEVTLGVVAAEAKAAGAKKVEVKFNQGVDASKVTFAVYNPTNVPVNVAKVTNSDDKATYTLELASKLIKGEYTVKANGLSQEVVAKFTAEDEKVAKIEFVSDKAALDRSNKKVVTAAVKISNQYGEDVTSNQIGSVTFNAQTGISVAKKQDNSGVLVITTAGNDFAIDNKILVTALHSGAALFASATLTVSDQARVYDIEVSKLYNSDSSATLNVNSTASDFKLVVVAKDQYGNVISDLNVLREDLIVTNTNSYVAKYAELTVAQRTYANFTSETIDGKSATVLALAPGTNGTTPALTAGTAKFTFLTPFSSKNAAFDVVVKDKAKTKDITLSQPALAVAGEKIEIPFTAVDQFGNAMKNAKDLNASDAFLLKATSSGTLAFEQDYVKGTAKLVLDTKNVAAKTFVTINLISSTNVAQSISFTLVEAAKGAVISGTKDFTKDFLKDATGTLKAGNVVVKDQYGRDFSLDASYRVTVKSSDTSKVVLGGVKVADDVYNVSDANGASLNAKGKGAATITLTLQKDGTDVEGSQYTFNSKVVEKADVSSYEIADVATLYSAASGYAAGYDKALTVNGVLADGSKVVVPAGYYQAFVSGDGVSINNAGKLQATGNTGFDNGNKEVKVTAIVDGANGPETVTKQVKVSTAAPAPVKLEVVENGKAKKVDTNVISASQADVRASLAAVAQDAVKTTDQYGVELTNDVVVPVPTNLPANKTVGTIEAGDTFNVTVVNNGIAISFKVIVTA